jgi:glycerophosphoryl diester phosphodiesterase
MGADFLEQDVVASRDGELVVLHDLWLDEISDVAVRYPTRKRADEHFYVIDFDWAELETLRLTERKPVPLGAANQRNRFSVDLPIFRITRLADELQLIRELNALTRGSTGIYPEIKQPAFHRLHGVDLSRAVLELLDSLGYALDGKQTFLQCFDEREMERLYGELGSSRGLIQLLNPAQISAFDTDSAAIASVARRTQGLGLPYDCLLSSESKAGALVAADRAVALKSAGLELHPYTFRADQDVAPARSFAALIGFFARELRVDALFTDHPDQALAVIDELAKADTERMDSPEFLP